MIDYKSRLCISRNTKWICTFSYFVPAAVIIIVLIIVYNSEFLNINNLFFVFFLFFFVVKILFIISRLIEKEEKTSEETILWFFTNKQKKTNHQFGRAAKGRTRLRKNHKIKLERKKPPSSLFYFLSFPIFFFFS